MKKIIYLLFVLTLTSCSTYKIPYDVQSYYTDYSVYAKKGFFITESNSVSFEYTPVGSLIVEVSSGYDNNVSASSSQKSYSTAKSKSSKKWRYANVNEALNILYEDALYMRANGIINLQIKIVPAVYNKDVMVSSDRIIISGMAIKKK